MYFDFEDYRPDIHAGRPRDLVARGRPAVDHRPPGAGHPGCCCCRSWFPVDRERGARARARARRAAAQQQRQPTRFVFVQPRVDREGADAAAERAEASDQGSPARTARAAESRPTRCRSRAATRRSGSSSCERRRRAGEDPSPIRRPASRREPSIREPSRRRRRSRSLDRCSCRRAAAAAARERAPRQRPPAPGGSLGDALRNLQRYVADRSVRQPAGRRRPFGPAIQFDTKGVEFGPWIRRFVAQVKRNWLIPVRRDVDEGARRHHVQRAQERHDHRPHGRRPVADRRVQQRRVRRAGVVESDGSRCRRSIPSDKAFFTVTFFYNEAAAELSHAHAPQQLGLC